MIERARNGAFSLSLVIPIGVRKLNNGPSIHRSFFLPIRDSSFRNTFYPLPPFLLNDAEITAAIKFLVMGCRAKRKEQEGEDQQLLFCCCAAVDGL